MATRRLASCPRFAKLKWRSYPGGAYAHISKSRARFVIHRATAAAEIRAGRRLTMPYPLPKPGYEVKICPGMRLVNRAGKFELDRAWEGFRRRRS